MTIGTTILDQLGGRRFLAMTGAHSLLRLERGLSFRLPGRLRQRINYVAISLGADDLYDVEFGRVARLSYAPVDRLAGVGVAELARAIGERTGLAVSL